MVHFVRVTFSSLDHVKPNAQVRNISIGPGANWTDWSTGVPDNRKIGRNSKNDMSTVNFGFHFGSGTLSQSIRPHIWSFDCSFAKPVGTFGRLQSVMLKHRGDAIPLRRKTLSIWRYFVVSDCRHTLANFTWLAGRFSRCAILKYSMQFDVRCKSNYSKGHDISV